MKNQRFGIKASVVGMVFAMSAGVALAAPSPFSALPTPDNNPYATYGTYKDATGTNRDAILLNGIPIAFKYDSFWSYSAPLLDAIQTKSPSLLSPSYGSYDFSVGTGTIAVNLTSNAGGAKNINPNGSGVTMQNPVDIASNNTVLGWQGTWGGLTQTYTNNPTGGDYPAGKPAGDADGANDGDANGTTTVGNMLTYLKSLNPFATIPVIYADYNQTGSFDSLWVSAKVEVFDSTGATKLATWALDTLNNGQLDAGAPTFNYGVVNFFGTQAACAAAGAYNPLTNPNGCAGVTANGDSYLSLDHNKGSGKPDFLVYSPEMDLSLFNATDLLVFTVNVGCYGNVGPLGGPTVLDKNGKEVKNTLGCNTNGGEEFGILGAIVPDHDVPEPGTLALIGFGLGGLGLASRRRKVS